MKLQPLTRAIEGIKRADGGDARTYEISFSSETPVERWFGNEILVHDSKAADLSRLNDGAPMLFNHNLDDPLGVVERAWIGGDKRGYAIVRFAQTARAEEMQSMVNDGVLRNVSFMYRVREWEQTSKNTDEFRVTDWQALEISLVTVPADNSVGFNRQMLEGRRDFSAEDIKVRVRPEAEQTAGARTMDGTAPTTEQTEQQQQEQRSGGGALSPAIDLGELEKQRVETIKRVAKDCNVPDQVRDGWLHGGVPVEEIQRQVIALYQARAKHEKPASFVGLTDQETERYSLFRAINAVVSQNWAKAGLELRAHEAIQGKLGSLAKRDDRVFYVPLEVQQRALPREAINYAAKRDINVAGSAGYLVATDNLSFIDLLRHRSVAMRMGATVMSGLTGNVTIPRQTAAATAYWLSTESTAITESQQTFDQVSLTPKNVGAYTEISKQLLAQSAPAAEGIVNVDLATVVALAADSAAINGDGTGGAPTGILNTSGIGSVTGTSLAYAGVLEFQTDLAGSDVMPAQGGYCTTPTVASLMAQRVAFTNTASPLWAGNIWDGQMVGFRAMSSNQMPSATMIFGDWAALILAEWDVLSVEVNPYANFQAGLVGVRAWYMMDVAVRRAAEFSAANTIT